MEIKVPTLPLINNAKISGFEILQLFHADAPTELESEAAKSKTLTHSDIVIDIVDNENRCGENMQ